MQFSTSSAFSMDLLTGQKEFGPKKSLIGKSNFSRNVFINEDGSHREVVRLNVLDDRDREDLIAFHFSRQYAVVHYGGDLSAPQFYVIGRDCPWDLHYRMHDGSDFFLEICRVADVKFLTLLKAENEAVTLLQRRNLRGRDILKLEKNFPGTLPSEVVALVQTRSDRDRIFDLGEEDRVPQAFMRPTFDPSVDMESAMRQAIQKKLNKRHDGKDRTILVLDNLTTHEQPQDVFNAIEKLQDFVGSTPFRSIWLYTGYYSEINGSDCEFSLVPVKADAATVAYYERELSGEGR